MVRLISVISQYPHSCKDNFMKNLRKLFIPNLDLFVSFKVSFTVFLYLLKSGETFDCIYLAIFILVPEASRLSMIGGVALLAIALFLSILSVCIEKDVHFAMTTIYTIACECICI